MAAQDFKSHRFGLSLTVCHGGDSSRARFSDQSQLDGRLPLTLRAAARVANVLKHDAPGDAVAPRYANYM